MTCVMRTIAPKAVLVAALLFTASCGSGGPEPAPEPTPSPSPADSCRVSPAVPPDGAVQGETNQGELWAIPPGPWEPIAGEDFRINLRVAGSGDFSVAAIGPDGSQHEPTIGPIRQFGARSEFARPGQEWEMFFVFTEAGCWHLEVTRGDLEGAIYFEVNESPGSSA